MKKRILTGDRPTGPMHFGHYVGSLQNRVRLQDEYDCFFIIADFQVLTDHLQETEQTEQSIKEVLPHLRHPLKYGSLMKQSGLQHRQALGSRRFQWCRDRRGEGHIQDKGICSCGKEG